MEENKQLINDNFQEQENTEQKSTFINIKYDQGTIIVESECKDVAVFLTLIKYMKPLLAEAVISSIKDSATRILLYKSIQDNQLVVRPTNVFDLREKK